MFKKILSSMISVCILLGMFASLSFAAVAEDVQIEQAKKAIKDGAATLNIVNDTTSDEFLREAKLLLPEGSEVNLAFSKETDYRIYNATSEKDGSVFVNIEFTCGPYKTHEMYDIKIAKLTGAAAEANADRESLTKDAALVKAAFSNMSFANTITEEEILEKARAAVQNGSTVTSKGDFTKVDATETKRGSAKVTLELTLNKDTTTVKISNVVHPTSEDKPAEDTTTPVKFTDVASDAYYADAVAWAVSKNITSGTAPTTFSPDATCTRAQILTFLWRAVGSPKTTSDNSFIDVKSSDYYYEAALWAKESGMVEGDTFAAATPCTRASTVNYLWIYAGKPADIYDDDFTDVSSDAYYAEAVAWALNEGVTSGTSDTTFSPDSICSRAQIVTFLNRTVER